MAGFLVVAGVDLIVTSMQERQRTVRGEAVRAFDNTLMGGTDAGKASWNVELFSMTLAEADTFRAAVEGVGLVECWGAKLRKTEGAPGLYRVEIQDVESGPRLVETSPGVFREDWEDYGEVIRFTLEER